MTVQATLRVAENVQDETLCAAILNQLELPVLLVEADTSVSYANAAAKAIIDSEDLVHAVSSDHGTSRDGERLRAAIADTCATGAGRVVVLNGDDTVSPLVALALPFRDTERHHNGRALVLLRSNKGESEFLINSLRRLFRLSPAEASIAVSLGAGIDLTELARQRGVKLNTLRSQVASIMAKTGTRRQAQLVALVARIDSIV